MTGPHPLPLSRLRTKSLRHSDEFATIINGDGETVVYKFADPGQFVHIGDAERVLLSYFPTQGALRADEAVSRFQSQNHGAPFYSRIQLLRFVQKLHAHGVLVSNRCAVSAYTARMVRYYAAHRQIPEDIGAAIIAEGNIGEATAVLDIGTGVGSLAIQLARQSENVTGIDISRSFMATSEEKARAAKVRVKFCLLDANKLKFHSAKYDAITISQAFHWLHPVWGATGIYHVLRPSGLVFFLESKPVLSELHPFRLILGYGYEDKSSVQAQCVQHAKRYVHLFKFFSTPEAHIQINGMWLFRQKRRFDMGFARAFFFSRELRKAFPGRDDPWKKLEQSLTSVPPEAMYGDMYWMLIRFRNNRRPESPPKGIEDTNILNVREIPCLDARPLPHRTGDGERLLVVPGKGSARENYILR